MKLGKRVPGTGKIKKGKVREKRRRDYMRSPRLEEDQRSRGAVEGVKSERVGNTIRYVDREEHVYIILCLCSYKLLKATINHL